MDSGRVGFGCLLDSVFSDATSGVGVVEFIDGLAASVSLLSARAESELASGAEVAGLGAIFPGSVELKSFSWAANSKSRISLELLAMLMLVWLGVCGPNLLKK